MPRQAQLGSAHRPTSVVAGILCDAADRVLISDRAHARSMREYWEFPGGKVHVGESPEMALSRELREELGITVREQAHLQTLRHDYPDQSVEIAFYLVQRWQGTPTGIEGQALRWVKKAALSTANLLPADAPLVAAIIADQRQNKSIKSIS